MPLTILLTTNFNQESLHFSCLQNFVKATEGTL